MAKQKSLLDQLQETMTQRGETYAPGGNRFANLEMHSAIHNAIVAELERQEVEIDGAEEQMISHMADKTARSVCGALGGIVHEDNAMDILGYAVILAAYRTSTTPEALLEGIQRQRAKQ